jgi:hypothetical protein
VDISNAAAWERRFTFRRNEESNVADELVFAVEDREATAARPVTFADAGLREREHLQEWVIRNPDIIGPGVMIVGFEFDRWMTATRSRKSAIALTGPPGSGPPFVRVRRPADGTPG